MEILVVQEARKVPITVLKLIGELDASCFKDVIAAGRRAFESGAHDLLLDLSEVGFMSSSGLVALHSLALIMRGEQAPNLDQGWSAMHAVADYVDDTPEFERHFKLYNPSPKVRQTLEKTGFNHTFEVFMDLETALDAFG